MLYFRRIRPTRVTRGSLVTFENRAGHFIQAASSCFNCSASVTIDLNLYMTNGLPFRSGPLLAKKNRTARA